MEQATKGNSKQNSEIKDELNAFNLNDKIMKYKSPWTKSREMNEKQENPNITQITTRNLRRPIVELMRATYFSRGRNRPRMA
jgi:hypothetical protein